MFVVLATREDATRAQYESAARERVMATLTRIIATFEGFPPKIMRMCALDAEAMDALSGSMADDLDLINEDMAAFEETLTNLGE